MSWSDFITKLCQYLDKKYSETDAAITHIKSLICEITDDQYSVSIENFKKMNFWFGDISSDADNTNLFDTLNQILSECWYYGNESANGAEGILRSYSIPSSGLFLVRLNSGTHLSPELSPFTLSTMEISPSGQTCIRHLRIYVDKEHNRYIFNDKFKGEYSCPNHGLVFLVAHLMEQRRDLCSVPCPKQEIHLY